MKKANHATDPFKDYFYLGKITKAHGYDGKVTAFLDVDDPSIYESIEMVFVNINQQAVPFFIESSSLKNNKLLIRFQDIDNAEKAASLVNKQLFLPLSMLPKLSGNRFYFHEIIGFMLIDNDFGPLGPIEEILDYPNQAVMQVFYQGKEVLIPISEAVIKKLDRKNKSLHIQAPEGLIDVYLSA
jgi:16S rRNA processing protein RimM